MLGDTDVGSGTLRFAKDYIGVDYHNDGHSHIDALCHVAFDGALYNGRTVDSRHRRGALRRYDRGRQERSGRARRAARRAAVREVAWLEPGEHIFREDLEAAERGRASRSAEGDILLVRTGHAGGWPSRAVGHARPPRPAFTRPVRRSLAERRIAALGSDGNSDTAPSTHRGDRFPIHVLALNAMGVHLLDYLPVRGPRRRLRAGRPLGVPVRRSTAADRWRDRLAPQPDGDLLTAHLAMRAERRRGRALPAKHPAAPSRASARARMATTAASPRQPWRSPSPPAASPFTSVPSRRED